MIGIFNGLVLQTSEARSHSPQPRFPRQHRYTVVSILIGMYDNIYMHLETVLMHIDNSGLSLSHSFTHNSTLYRERVVVEYEHTGELLVDLASDQTSLHNPFGGGYYPVQLSYNEAQKLMSSDPLRFKELVQERYMTWCKGMR